MSGSVTRDIIIAVAVLSSFLVVYLVVAGIIGLLHKNSIVCPAGFRAISIDGQRSKLPKTSSDLVVTDADYPLCSPMLSCPTQGQKWAVHRDGSALTNTCDLPGCQCTIFQHCPAYVGTLFREFGREQRISLFQVVDPNANPSSGIASGIPDPFDPPYGIIAGERDTCFLNPTTLPMVWPAINFGDKCIRGKLSKLKTSPNNIFLCAPDSYVDAQGEFDVESYMANYRKT